MLRELTAEDLIGLGVSSIGLRRKLLAAIAALGDWFDDKSARVSVAGLAASQTSASTSFARNACSYRWSPKRFSQAAMSTTASLIGLSLALVKTSSVYLWRDTSESVWPRSCRRSVARRLTEREWLTARLPLEWAPS
jgi:hypothetical protein